MTRAPADLAIRAERESDADAVHRVVAAAFGREDEALLVRRIREAGDATIALVAERDDAIVGHVLASAIAVERRAGPWLGIAPLSVEPAQQGRGVGSALMLAVIDRARTRGTEALFLLGNPAYYRRFGFVTAHVGNEYGARDSFMQLELIPEALAGVTGTARYVPAFGV